MIGTKQITIDASDFVKGMSTSPEVSDGGFSPDVDAVNLTYTPGILYAPASAVDSDTDTRLTGEIIAWCSDDDVALPNYQRKMVSNDGKYYRYNGTKIPEAALRTDATNTYTENFTQMVSFAGETYVTTREKLVRWDETGAVFNTSFFSFTNTSFPHPAIIYENYAYYADGNVLYQQTSAGGTPTTILTLSSDQMIIALGVDPGTGLMLISTTSLLNMSDTKAAVNKLLWYDGNSPKVSKAIFVEDVIESFQTVGGITFVGYGQNLGYINGSGISFLRRLKNVTLDSTYLPYQQRITNIGNTLYVVDGTQILAYGEVLPGRKVFYYAFKNNINSNPIISISNVGSGKLGISFVDNKFYTFDTTSISTNGNITFPTNKFTFLRPVYLRSVYLEYATAIPDADSNRTLYYKDETQSSFSQLQVQGGSGLANNSGGSVYFIDNVIGFLNNKIRTAWFRYSTGSVVSGLKRIIIYYDPAE